MKRALFAALLLAGCATTPAPPGTQVAAAGSFVLKSELGKASAEHSH